VARDPELRIVIAGKADAATIRYDADMHRLASRLGVAGKIVWPGHLAQSEMAWAFERCAAFVVTSRAEACPNIALEALSHGAPVVSTSQEPMPEFFKDTATYYQPEDADMLAARVNELVAEPAPSASRRREAARARAAEFPWARPAEQTIAQLELATR
jgi:glycosyltransferase involved in cell wall biosynthesis